MRRRCTCRMSVVLTLCLSLAVAASLLPLSAEPAVSQAIVFADTFSREDAAATPADSLGKTEPGPGQVVLDYRELGGCCGTPSMADVAQITAGSLVVRGPGTDPAWVELDGAGSDMDLRVDAEVLTPYVAPSTIANSVSFLFRNAGFGADGTVFTPGSISFELFPTGRFSFTASVPA